MATSRLPEVPRLEPHRAHDKGLAPAYLVLYDSQCEVCQASVSWLKVLDKNNKTRRIAINDVDLSTIDSRLQLEDCMRELHVVTPQGDIFIGWDAVACLARLFPTTWIIGTVGRIFPCRNIARAMYRFIARHRYALSKCRGGACHVSSPETVRKRATIGSFWSCYTLGFLLRAPLVIWSGIRSVFSKLSVFLRTYGRRIVLLDGKLQLLFLNGLLPNSVPLLFGESFVTVLYDGVALDPGSPKMRRSLSRHLRKLPTKIIKVVATHAHEEHVGNLNWLSDRTGAHIFVSEMTSRFLMPYKKLPWARRVIIGQPPDLKPPFHVLSNALESQSSQLQVFPAPGHCDDHIVFYDPKEKVLLAGDAFMGAYFSTPNPDVDSHKWLVTLERLAQLDIEILVEGHGHVHTLRTDVPDIPGVVIREDPKAAILEKLTYMRWLRQQIEDGVAEGLPLRVIEATCFPWAKRYSWETCANDECIRLLSLGHFSRSELVRSFVRKDGDTLPTVYQVRFYGDDARA